MLMMKSKNIMLEDGFKALADLITDPVVIIDQKGTFLGMNQAFKQLIAANSEELISRSFLEADILDNANKAVLAEIMERKFKGFEVEPCEITVTAKNGENRRFEVGGRSIECSEEPISLVLLRDVTAREVRQEKLTNSQDSKYKDPFESRLRSIFDYSPDAIVVYDLNGNIVGCNQAALDLHGFSSRDNLIGKNVLELVSPKDNQRAIFASGGLFKIGSVKNAEFTLLTNGGNEFTASFSAIVTKDSLGNPTGFVTTARDISERKVLEKRLSDYSKHLKSMVEIRTAQLKDANERLLKSERLAAIGELAGMVGHDLRNPLTSINNAVYYLNKKRKCTGADEKKMLEIINKAIEHANKIINNLLEYSREMHLDLAVYSPKSLLKDALSLVRVPDGIKIVDHTTEEPAMRVDADKMVRVFINLIKNAIDAMPEGGTLEIRSIRKAQNIEFAFIDSGKGIPDKLMPKIFTPLVTTKAQGMGFGLAICKRIVEAHDGKIAFESVAGKGTTFTVVLPVKPSLKSWR